MSEPPRLLVVGLGSIGARHVREARGLGLEVGVVSRRSSPGEAAWGDLSGALRGFRPGAVVIARETAAHAETLAELRAVGFTGPVLVEKPLLARLPAPGEASPDLAGVTVAYNLRLHPSLVALRERLGDEAALTARIHCGSYLPDWRPGQDYRFSASARRASGGGVLTDLSHELDYLLWLFGPWRRVSALGGRLGPLEIDVPDVVEALVETERCAAVSLHLDYLQRVPRREVLVTTATRTLRLDLLAGLLEESGRSDQVVPEGAIARTYPEQLRVWLGLTDPVDTVDPADRGNPEGPADPTAPGDQGGPGAASDPADGSGSAPAELCTGEEGMEVVALMDALERALEEGRWIPNEDR